MEFTVNEAIVAHTVKVKPKYKYVYIVVSNKIEEEKLCSVFFEKVGYIPKKVFIRTDYEFLGEVLIGPCGGYDTEAMRMCVFRLRNMDAYVIVKNSNLSFMIRDLIYFIQGSKIPVAYGLTIREQEEAALNHTQIANNDSTSERA